MTTRYFMTVRTGKTRAATGTYSSRDMAKRWLWIAAYLAIGIAGAVRVASTHRVFSEVLDEPAHVACGYEWLTSRGYATDMSHPPLERILSALPAVMERVPPPPSDLDFVGRGNMILYANDHYEHNLAAARMGNLLLFVIGMAAVAAWGWRLFGPGIGLLAMAMYASLPPILGHAGVATTDLAVATMLTLSWIALDRWLDQPSLGRGAVVGLCVGLGVLAKFSFLLFFPITAAVLIAVRIAKRNGAASARSLGIALLVAFFVVWAGYKFTFGRTAETHPDGKFYIETPAPAPLRPAAKWFSLNVPVPAPELLVGIGIVKMHDLSGHLTYLLGHYRKHGWWYYFPVVFFFKTPLPFLVLALWGIVLALRARPEIALIPIVLMLSVMPSSINIGIRHILPIYAPLCIAAAYAAVSIWRSARDAFGRTALVALLAWLFIGGALAHPDYLAWFNEAAGEHPEEIVVDSNLDWGQDVLRLQRAVAHRNIDKLWVVYSGNADLGRHNIQADGLMPFTKKSGWIATSETALKLDDNARAGGYRWLTDHYKPRMVGKGIRLYYVPE